MTIKECVKHKFDLIKTIAFKNINNTTLKFFQTFLLHRKTVEAIIKNQ